MDAGCAADESAILRTAKSCGPDAPTLASSVAEAMSALTGLTRRYPRGDGGKQARSPGRARNKLLKPSRAGMPGDPGATVVTNSCAFYTLRTRLRVQRAPGIPHALFGRKVHAQLGRYPRRGNVQVHVELERHHCEERKRRSNPLLLSCCSIDCFAESVIGRAFARPVGSQ
jgi:hypothetical protein